jgi:hypothetical protein
VPQAGVSRVGHITYIFGVYTPAVEIRAVFAYTSGAFDVQFDRMCADSMSAR